MESTTAAQTPDAEVQALMMQVSDEHGLGLQLDMSTGAMSVGKSTETAEEDDLQARLAKLSAGG